MAKIREYKVSYTEKKSNYNRQRSLLVFADNATQAKTKARNKIKNSLDIVNFKIDEVKFTKWVGLRTI